jgi:hypothetical protein
MYLKDLVAQTLADRGLPGTVDIRPHLPLAKRLETGQRAQFVVEYRGDGTASLVLDEHEISGGTVGAPIARAIADRIVAARRQENIAA